MDMWKIIGWCLVAGFFIVVFQSVTEQKPISIEKKNQYERQTRQIELEEMAKSMVRKRMKDPESTQFENIQENTYDGIVCGYYSARNSFGGYSDFEGFIADETGKMPVFEHDLGFTKFKKLWMQLC